MPKKLLSPELAQVLKDINNTREAINEKYTMVGHPDPIPEPLSSRDMAEAVRAITSLGDLPVLNGAIELTYNEKQKELPGGYYKDGINAKIKDYAVSYIWNRKGIPAKTQYVNIDESFTIPDFGIAEVDGEEFKGWSHMPDDNDPEYLTGDVVNHFQYEPRLDDSQYISYLYAIYEIVKLSPIELSFEYKNKGRVNASGQETVKMKVNGQKLDYPNLQREHEIQGNPQTVEDIETGPDWYKHQFIFNKIGIYPVLVTHIGKNENREVAAGVIKIANVDGSMNDDGTMEDNAPYGSWYDSGWVATSIMRGIYLSSLKFEVRFQGHGNSYKTDALAVFIKKTDGSTYIVYDYGNTQIRLADTTNLGTPSMLTDGKSSGPITLGNVTLQRGDLNKIHHYVPGPSATNLINFTKADDVRQARFFVFSAHYNTNCFNGAIINYDINYKFDMDLWESDENLPSDFGGGGDGGTSSTQPVDMRLSALSLTPGTLSPTFDKDTHDYTLTVPAGTNSVSVNATLIDSRTQYQINGLNNTDVTLKPANGPSITKIEIDVMAILGYINLPTINGNVENGAVGRYTINIVEEASSTPPSITPTLSEGNYSYEDPNNCLSQKWGYYEMSKFSNGEEYLELYRRIYNAIKYGDTKSSYDYQEYGTTNIKMQSPVVQNNISVGLSHTISAILVPFDDLTLDNNQAEYVYKCVCIDCPELMWRFSSVEDNADNSSDIFATGVIDERKYLLLPYFKDSVKNNYLGVCESTFQDICSIVQSTYGITFQDDIFSNNNARYTEDDKKKIGKVIHDYLEINNVYGFVAATDGLNQIMYPALSKGKSHPVCASYAQAFKYCCWRYGIHAVCVNGGCGDTRDIRHQWNLVSYKTGDISTLDGEEGAWQEVDCTWDDPYGENGNNINPNACSWKYFNVTTSDLESDQPTKDYVDAVKAAGYTFNGDDPVCKVRSRFSTKYPIIANTETAVNIEHYINYPANGTCADNHYNFFDNTNSPPAPPFNGQVYDGF